MNGITPSMVREAYDKTGLKPIRGHYHIATDPNNPDDPRLCGCALTALYCAGGYPLEFATSIGIHTYAENVLGCGTPYVRGFMCGFDDAVRMQSEPNSFHRGYDDGKAAAKEVFDELESARKEGATP